MANYRMLPANFLTREVVVNLSVDQKLILVHLYTGKDATGMTEIGIYEIGYTNIADVLHLSKETVIEAFKVFDSSFFAYDEKTEFIFLKDFFQIQVDSGLLAANLTTVVAVHRDFKRYSSKCPLFFGDFAKINEEKILNSFKSISDTGNDYEYYQHTIQLLFAYKDCFDPNSSPKNKNKNPGKSPKNLKTISDLTPFEKERLDRSF